MTDEELPEVELTHYEVEQSPDQVRYVAGRIIDMHNNRIDNKPGCSQCPAELGKSCLNLVWARGVQEGRISPRVGPPIPDDRTAASLARVSAFYADKISKHGQQRVFVAPRSPAW